MVRAVGFDLWSNAELPVKTVLKTCMLRVCPSVFILTVKGILSKSHFISVSLILIFLQF